MLQNSSKSAGTGLKARAINSSEFLMLMEYSALPEVMMRKLGVAPGGDGYARIWDVSCQGFYETLEGINVTWHSIHYPVGISLDNAPIHTMFRAAMLRPRVPLIEEYRTIFNAAMVELNFDIEDRQHIDRAFSEVEDRLSNEPAVAQTLQKTKLNMQLKKLSDIKERAKTMTGLQLYVHGACRQFKGGNVLCDVAEEVAEQMILPYTTASNANESAPWEAVFRRQQALIDPRWRCLLPEQFMPLGNTTPDLHQTAEMLVAAYKGAMKRWTLEQDPEQHELLYSANYDNVMQAENARRNEGNDTDQGLDQTAIRASLRKTWITAQIVATEYGVSFKPMLAPGERKEWGGHPTESRQANFYVMGTGGKFPEAKWS